MQQDGGGGGFGQEEEEREKDGTVHPEHFPERPAPVLGRDGEAGDDGT